ncbi:MAG: hypothetical protein FJ240_13110 [Nitrospira sp.]|nr:hypothetical protein [Nitrospira sp.]
MKKYFFVIADYQDYRREFFENITRARNKEYCHLHGFEYIELNKIEEPFRGNITWHKFKSILDLADEGTFKEGDIVVHLDADMCIVDGSVSFATNKTFTYAIDSCNTHCMGFYSLKLNEWGYDLLRNILDEKRYNSLKDQETVDSFEKMSSFWEIFKEQASWYSLAGIKRHSWYPFMKMKHFGFHSEKTEFTLYELNDLYRNVEILPETWNVTCVPEEDGKYIFYINPSRREDTIIRHFVGGRRWLISYFQKKMIV